MKSILNIRKIVIAAAVVIAVGGIFYAAASFNGMRDTLVREIHESREDADRLARNFELLARDSNEARAALGLPAREYESAEAEKPAEADAEDSRGDTTLLPYYQAVELLAAQSEKNARLREFAAVFEDDAVKAVQTKNAYRLRQEAGVLFWEKNGRDWFGFYPAGSSSGFTAESFRNTSYTFNAADAGFLRFLETESAELAAHFKAVDDLPGQFRAALREQAFVSELRSRNLVVEPLADTREEVSAQISIARERGAAKLRLVLDKKSGAFFVGNESFTGLAAFRNGLLAAVKNLDLRTADELIIEEGKKQIEELFNDTGFIAYLATKNLTLSKTPNEDEEYVYYDFLTSGGKKAGSLGIQKKIGEIYLFDDEYVSLGSLKTIGLKDNQASAGAKKKLNIDALPAPAGISSGGEKIRTILVAGAHERMTDTLILANINEEKQTIDLVSLPRDLFYRNRKINGIYYRYGPDKLVEEISGLTGLNIENYVIIDMFAFIDAINVLGGIDITLDEALVDPTYRVRDNGRWSTLFYAAGTHHLNGVEALRVARSRHFTSDFGRSRRQQDVLAAIKDKLSGLGVSDLGKIYDLAMVLTKYVETNYTPYDLVNSFVRYRSAKIRSQTVIATDNILYSTYTNLRHMKMTEEEAPEDFDKGAYILLPLEEDWSLVRRFILSRLEGPSA